MRRRTGAKTFIFSLPLQSTGGRDATRARTEIACICNAVSAFTGDFATHKRRFHPAWKRRMENNAFRTHERARCCNRKGKRGEKGREIKGEPAGRPEQNRDVDSRRDLRESICAKLKVIPVIITAPVSFVVLPFICSQRACYAKSVLIMLLPSARNIHDSRTSSLGHLKRENISAQKYFFRLRRREKDSGRETVSGRSLFELSSNSIECHPSVNPVVEVFALQAPRSKSKNRLEFVIFPRKLLSEKTNFSFRFPDKFDVRLPIS